MAKAASAQRPQDQAALPASLSSLDAPLPGLAEAGFSREVLLALRAELQAILELTREPVEPEATGEAEHRDAAAAPSAPARS